MNHDDAFEEDMEFEHDPHNGEEEDVIGDLPLPGGLGSVIGWLYDKAVSGIAGIESAEILAERYLEDANGDVRLAARNMVHWESIKAGSTGFLSGIGGVVALPFTLPLNVTSVLFLQTRLIAALACLGGHRLADERIRALAGLCLCGNAARALLHDVTMKAVARWGRTFTEQIIQKTLILMAARAGVSAGGQFVRLVPLAGGVVSGAVDVTTTRTVGRIACNTFLRPLPGLGSTTQENS